MRSTFSTPLAADNGVRASDLLSGKYLTFSSVLVIPSAYRILEAGQALPASTGRRQPLRRQAMAMELPRPLSIYFAAKNRHDIDGMLIPFSPDAKVRDESETHLGPT